MSTSEQTNEQYSGYERARKLSRKLVILWINNEQARHAKKLEIYWKEVITELNKKDSVKQKLEEEEKKNINPQSKKSRSTITLFCMVQENVHNAFAININRNKTISELKSLIQKEKYNDFAGIDPDQLKLWQVEIPDENYDELINLQLHENNELLATKKISKYFTKDPSDKHIYIIVSLPETAAFKWVANIEQLTLKDLKETIFSLYQFPELEKNGAILAFSCNDKKYSP
ncbi:hypothetical protein C1646_777245 [Rhizophagus diaphanus]|nr:hypothetical protein C1646_777245 [Rhizophagus diaphanus] [Rhizophagus sp. MUCL 43196]